MAGVIYLGIPLTLLLLALFTRRRARRLVADDTHPGLQRLDTTTLRARRLGLVVAAAIAVLVALVGGGQGLVASVTVGCLVVALFLVAGEARAWRSAQTPGTASLEERRPVRYLPWALLTVAIACFACLTGLLVWCARHQDDTGAQWCWSSPGFSTCGGPFPGTHYSFPMGMALLALLATCSTGISMTLRRPRNGADPVVVAVDDDARRRTIAGLVGCLGVAVAVDLDMALMMSGGAVAFFVSPARAQANGLGSGTALTLCLLLALVCGGLAAWFASVVLVPGSPRPIDRQAATAQLGVAVR